MYEAGALDSNGGDAGNGRSGEAGALQGSASAAPPTDGDSFVSLLAPLLRDREGNGEVCLVLDQCDGIGLPPLTLASLVSKLLLRVECLSVLMTSTEPVTLSGVAQRQVTIPPLAPHDCARLFIQLAPRALTHAEIGSDRLDLLVAEMEALVDYLRPSLPEIDHFSMSQAPGGEAAPPAMRLVRWKFSDQHSAELFANHVQAAADALVGLSDPAAQPADEAQQHPHQPAQLQSSALSLEVRGTSVVARLSNLRLLARHRAVRALAGSPRAISLAVHGLVADDGQPRSLDELGNLLESAGICSAAASSASGTVPIGPAVVGGAGSSAVWPPPSCSERSQQMLEQVRTALQLVPLDDGFPIGNLASGSSSGSLRGILSAPGSSSLGAGCGASTDPAQLKPAQMLSRSTSKRSADELPPQLEVDAAEIELEEWLGGGTFGAVYRGRYRGRRVAVKQFFARQPSLRAFSREAALLCHLRHPNVVQLMKVCSHGGKGLLIVTEYLPSSLYSFLHDSPPQPADKGRAERADGKGGSGAVGQPADGDGLLPHDEVVRLTRDIACGMQYLHTFQPAVLHRNLKSQNLLLNSSGRVKVADFGERGSRSRHNPTAAARPCDSARLPWWLQQRFARETGLRPAPGASQPGPRLGQVVWPLSARAHLPRDFCPLSVASPSLLARRLPVLALRAS
jgi:hypothetical protein